MINCKKAQLRKLLTPVELLTSPLFIIGLAVLILNDFVLKPQFSNFLTGKLSDFAGLFVFPFFFSALVFSRAKSIHILTGVLFILWKSPVADVFISFVNSIGTVSIGRTQDYSDLLALVAIPLSYFYLRFTKRLVTTESGKLRPWFAVGLAVTSLFAFTATTFEHDRSVWVDYKRSLHLTKYQLETRLKRIDDVSDVEIQGTQEAWPKDKYPDLELEPNRYYLEFKIKRPYCGWPELAIFTSFEENGENITLDGLNFRYWCKDAPSKKDHQQLVAIFNEIVGNKLNEPG